MRWRASIAKFTTAHYAATVSSIALLFSAGSLYVSKLSYDLSADREAREIQDKAPAIDLQVTPNNFASSADLTVSIFNRGDVNLAPQDLTVLHSFECGEFYISNRHQSVGKLKSSVSLLPMGTIAPRATGLMKVIVSGVTDGKDDCFRTGFDLEFVVRVRFGDRQDTFQTFPITRHVERMEND